MRNVLQCKNTVGVINMLLNVAIRMHPYSYKHTVLERLHSVSKLTSLRSVVHLVVIVTMNE